MRILIALIALACATATPVAANAAQLVVLERRGCVWCAHFEAEIAPVYPKTEEAKVAPLRRVDVDDPWPKDLPMISHDRFTPTFVLVDGGKEVSRLRGYPGDNFFWPLVDEMIAKLPAS